MQYFSGKGDQGRSSLSDGRLISKDDAAFELIGALDEATAHIGMAISLSRKPETIRTLRLIQDHLSKIMGIIAGAKNQNFDEVSFLKIALEWLEDQINVCSDNIEDPEGFIFAGQSSAGASIDVARTVVRRSERLAVRYFETVKDLKNDVLPYLNRLSSFLFIFRLFIDHKSNTKDIDNLV